MWLLYNLAFAAVYILMMPRFLWRMRHRGGYRKDFWQRLGCYDAATRAALTQHRRIWIHAVSVGEVFVALRYLDGLRAQDPGRRFLLTTTTSTGHQVAKARLGRDDMLLYFPADFPGVVRRVLRQINPVALILTETEIWPNLIRAAHRRGIPVLLINGRVSDGTYRGYRWLRGIARRVFACMDALLVQSQQDAHRLTSIGVSEALVHVVGTVKYDLQAASAESLLAVETFMGRCGIRAMDLVLLGGSTWAGEEAILLAIYKRLKAEIPNLKLVLIPRHVERAGDIIREINAVGDLSYVTRREHLSTAGSLGTPDVILVDTTGEMMAFYAAASLVFVGKSLLHQGGQNFMEPAALGKPVITGPHLENFPEVAEAFREAEAMMQVSNAQELETVSRQLLTDAAARAALGDRARLHVAGKAGALDTSVRIIHDVLASLTAAPAA
ncbi:MAG: 3-deoxy-D-manno-octulosonic acid transferase [Verrucomicrobia bacterium]|nr:3-deoxy-D-manno-octulosonic acid transferase [Verrucomicrobiota bacterium]